MRSLRIVKIGDELGIRLPRELHARLHAREGGVLFLRETASGYELYPDTTIEAQLGLADQIMDEDATVLRELAKC